MLRGLAGAVVLLMLVGCGAQAAPTIATYPPTATPAPTVTPLPAATVIAASAANVTATPVPTRRTLTATPGPSPTSLIAPSLSPAPATQTATRAPTRVGLLIDYFTTDAEFVTPGENLTLFWGARGASEARIFRVDEDDNRLARWDVAPTGQLTVSTASDDRDVARFVLEAVAGDVIAAESLVIPLRCPEGWFFDPAPDACPAAPVQLSTQAEQTFERGRMIWVEAQDRIYVVFEDGLVPEWAQYPDEYGDGVPDRDNTLVPPPGLQQPIRGFGLVWRSNPRVRERLGWAISPEVAYDGAFQIDSTELTIATQYFRMRDGGILALDALDDTWTVIPPGPGVAPDVPGATESGDDDTAAPPDAS